MRRAKVAAMPDWVSNSPETWEERVLLLEQNAYFMKEESLRGILLREWWGEIKGIYSQKLKQAQIAHPIAFFKPSYEQALMLNCWVWGINFPICFSANRIGKTVAFVINAILWTFPNNPSWLMFRPYIDKWGRLVVVIPRSPLRSMLHLQRFLLDNPHLMGNFYRQPYEEQNKNKWAEIKSQFATLQLGSPYPKPPIITSGTLWVGAPDNEFHKGIIMKRWGDYLPKSSIVSWVQNPSCSFTYTTQSKTNPTPTQFEVACKSYESKDTKWSGDAVQGIILTEGFTQDILDEVKQRIINNGFMSWDYTPAEPVNTGKKVALAKKVYDRREELPLRSFVFLRFSVAKAPEHIIPKEKREDLLRMWANRPEGKARIEGDFYASSGLVLDKLNRDFHCLDWSLQKLYQEFPGGCFYRSFDPGLDHPTACVWGYLSYNNIWFIYRAYSERGKTISERCKDIIELSNNTRKQFKSGNQGFWKEAHTKQNSEIFSRTFADYHIFKEDEDTGLNYAQKYIREGLIVSESVHMGPEERAVQINNLLDTQGFPYLANPKTGVPPGARIFFLTSQPGVAAMLDKYDNLFWDRLKSGDNKGEPKDKVPEHGDDELDALGQLVCSSVAWTQTKPKPYIPSESEPEYFILPAKRDKQGEFKPQSQPVGFT